MSSNRLSAKPYRHILFLMLAFGSALRLHAAAPGDGTSPAGVSARTRNPGRRPHRFPKGKACKRFPTGMRPSSARCRSGHSTSPRATVRSTRSLPTRRIRRHLDALPGRKLFRLAERRLRHQCRVQLDVAPGLRRRNRLLGRIHLGRTQRDPAYEPHPLHRTGVRRPAAGRAADGSSGKARASATAATSAATAIRRAAGAASASMNRPPWSSCWDATSAWARGSAGNG